MTNHKIKNKIGQESTGMQGYKKRGGFLDFLIFQFFGFLFFCFLWASFAFAQDRIVAVVNNDIISESDLKDFVNFMRMQAEPRLEGGDSESRIQSMESDSLDRLIEDKLIVQEAKKYSITVDESRVKGKIDEIKKGYSSDAEFQKALSSQGIVQADIEARIREQFLMYSIIDNKIKSKITINPVEVTEFYQKNIEEFKLSEQREFESITIRDGSLASEVSIKLKNNQDIQGLIEESSLSVSNISAMRDGRLRKEVEDVVFGLNLGEASEPIKFNDNYYVLKLEKIIPPRQQTLSEVKDKVFSFLLNMKMQEELSRWLDELKKQAYIKIL